MAPIHTANRPYATTGSLGGQQTSYNTQTAYWPQGAVSNYWYGNNVVPVYTYNSRLQMTDSWTTIGNDPNRYLSYLSPNWGTTNNNGNLQGVLEGYGASVPLISVGWLVQSYGYDTANRLVSVNDTGYTRNFGYDAWGNMWITGYTGIAPVGNPPTTSSGFNTNNQVTTGGAVYDAAGNQTVMNGDTVAYDAESRQSSITTATQAVEKYLYDGDGHRVKKVGPSVSTVYVYDALGQLAAEYSTATITPVCTTCYLVWDNLGSTRLVTNQNAAIVSRHDYLPFGEELGSSSVRPGTWGSTTDVNQKFTGQERDYENTPSLDYFGARYYASNLGRFTSPDPLLNSGRPWDPQTWNRYSYARNNPLAIVDPTGLYDLNNTCASDDKKCNKQFQQHAKDLKNGLSNLQKQVDKMKDGPEKPRLQNALSAIGTEGDHNGVNVAFGATKDGAAATTDPIFDQNTGKYSGFNITIDPAKENHGANGWAIDAAHEGTHVSDFENYMLNPDTALQPFQIEYRGYQTSAWAGQALGFDNLSYRGVQIWNNSWGAVDRQTLQDKGITKVVTDKDHPEVQPHNPFPNN